jgi:hypothetical protein
MHFGWLCEEPEKLLKVSAACFLPARSFLSMNYEAYHSDSVL